MIRKIFAVICVFWAIESTAQVKITKWHNNHAAALSITYDSGDSISEEERLTQHFLRQNDIQMDYELVTSGLTDETEKLIHMKQTMIPSGIQFFGHGHKHVLHDQLTEDEAYESFKACYNTMQKIGLRPIAYA